MYITIYFKKQRIDKKRRIREIYSSSAHDTPTIAEEYERCMK